MDFFGGVTRPITDLERVCNLPEVPPLTPEEIEFVSDTFIKKSAREEGFSLLPEQAQMVTQYLNFGGLFGCAAAGAGKTLTALLIANLAFRGDYTEKKKKTLYLLPSNLVNQLKHNISWTRKKINFTAPFYFFSDYKNVEDRINLSNKKEGVFVLGYGMLSGRKTEEMIQNVAADLIISDECHTLTNMKSARTGRINHYLKNADKDVDLVLLSGTIVRRSIMEYHHLMLACLKGLAPLPLPFPQAETLSIALSHSEGFIPSGEIRMAKPLADWAGLEWQEKPSDNIVVLRKAYNKRLRTAPGVFISDDDKVATSLQLDVIKSRTRGTYGYKELKELVEQVEESWVTPSGDEFDYILQKFKWINELWQGFYNDLVWPEDHPKVEEAKENRLLSNVLSKELRGFLNTKHRPHLDTPLLVRANMAKYGPKNVPELLYNSWREWKNFPKEGLPDRLSVPVRVSDFKVQAALDAWKNLEEKEEGGIVWYYNQEYGRWLTEVFKEEYGDRVLFCPAGQKPKEAMVESEGKICIATIEGHGTGTDGLQMKYHHNLVAQDLRTAKIAEQTIARTHRHGQDKDEMTFNILLASKYDDMQLSGILQNAYFIHTTHTRQRLLTGAWLNSPKHFDSVLLREAGVQVIKDFTDSDLKELEDLV